MDSGTAVAVTRALSSIRVARYEARGRACDPLVLPAYQGSTFRGALGHALKRVVCVVDHRDCPRCLLRDRCVYATCFESLTPPDTTALRRNSHRPHPFVLEPPLEERRQYAPGDALTVGLVLIGQAIESLPYFLLALRTMGQDGIGAGRGRFTVEEVLAVGSALRISITSPRSAAPASVPPPMTVEALLRPDDATATRLHLRFLTPTRLKTNGRLTDQLDFATLFSRLLDRLSSLARFYCGAALDLDFRAEKQAALAVRTVEQQLVWRDWERYSARQDTRMALGGLVGEAVYQGELGRFLPYLRLGELVHVGNGTAFGLGAFRIVSVTAEQGDLVGLMQTD